MEVLFDASEPAGVPLPAQLAEHYGGELALSRPLLYANFVTSLDGVTAVDPGAPGQGGLVSGGIAADRFLMGLLRAFADVVLIGAGTLRAESAHVWSPARVHPPAAAAYALLRRELGLAGALPLAVVTASGEVDPGLAALAGGLILTTEAGAARVGRPPAGVRVISLGRGAGVEVGAAVARLREEGFGRILTEGGPHLFGQLLGAGLVDELFLTLAPVLAGRERDSTQIALVEGISLLPERAPRGRLLSTRRSEDHLFLRYALS